MARVIVNQKVFSDILLRDAKKRQPAMYNIAKRTFDAKKRGELLGNFSNHSVTLEMEAGPAASSSFLPKGNLYSFLGFHPDTDLTGPIWDVLNDNTRLLNQATISRSGKNRIRYNFQGVMPSVEDITSIAPNPPDWGEKSWVEYVEEGIPNFIYYLFSQDGFGSQRNSRSGHGLQRSKQTSSPIKGIPYIKDLLNKFAKLFK